MVTAKKSMKRQAVRSSAPAIVGGSLSAKAERGPRQRDRNEALSHVDFPLLESSKSNTIRLWKCLFHGSGRWELLRTPSGAEPESISGASCKGPSKSECLSCKK